MRDIDYGALDAGIRATVAFLRRQGFATTDSGDGTSKPVDERVLDMPHVFMTCDASELVDEAERLREVIDSIGGHVTPNGGNVMGEPGAEIAASYDPATGVAIIMLTHWTAPEVAL